MAALGIVEKSVSTAVFILAIVLFRSIFKHRLPKSAFVILWVTALAKLLCPIPLPSRFSIYSILSMGSKAKGGEPLMQTLQGPTGNIAIEQTAALKQGNVINVPLLLWASGAFLLGAVFLLAIIKNEKKLSFALPVNDHDLIHAWKKDITLIRPVRILVFDRIQTPLAVGIWRPRIILPKKIDWEDPVLLRSILTHELVHIRRLDQIWKWLSITALCIYWFQPAVWLLYYLLNRDLELACDEKTVSILGEKEKAGYAMSLLKMAEKKKSAIPLYSNFSKNAVEERIVSIMKYKKISGAAIALTVVMMVSLTTVFATDAKLSSNVLRMERYYGVSMMEGGKENIQEAFQEYERFGLKFNGSTKQFFYNGKMVREFYDPEGGKGFQREQGEIDLLPIYSNGLLTGLEAASKEEFDLRTKEREEEKAAMKMTSNHIATAKEADVITESADNGLNSTMDEDLQISFKDGAIEWYTEEEYQTWMNEEEAAIQKQIKEGTVSKQEGAERILRNKNTLKSIQEGGKYSKPVNIAGQEGMIQMHITPENAQSFFIESKDKLDIK